MSQNPPKFVILYAEDDLDDLHLVQECFSEYADSIEILHVPNGRDALRMLELLKTKSIEPCLIILDINMPVMDGKQTLTVIKRQPAFKDIPVLLFTTSSSSLDREFARKWGADFITKPLKMPDLERLATEFSQRCKQNILKRALRANYLLGEEGWKKLPPRLPER